LTVDEVAVEIEVVVDGSELLQRLHPAPSEASLILVA